MKISNKQDSNFGIRVNNIKRIFSVKDNRIGLDSQHKKKVFKMFQLLHTPKENIKGLELEIE